MTDSSERLEWELTSLRPADVSPRLRRQIARRLRPRRLIRSGRRAVVSAAAAVLLLVLGSIAIRSGLSLTPSINHDSHGEVAAKHTSNSGIGAARPDWDSWTLTASTRVSTTEELDDLLVTRSRKPISVSSRPTLTAAGGNLGLE